jgi:hypothetical protein
MFFSPNSDTAISRGAANHQTLDIALIALQKLEAKFKIALPAL